MKILIGYESSGVVRSAFRAQGHDAWSCDLQPADDGSPNHFQCNVWDVINRDWDMGIFHPSCTFITISAAWAFTDGPYHQKVKAGTLVGKARRDARDAAIAEVRKIMALPYPKAVENPIGAISSAIRKPDQIIQPYNFGEDASKATCLWLDRLPLLIGTAFTPPRMVCTCGKCFTCHPREILPARLLSFPTAQKDCCPHCGAEAANAKPRWQNQCDNGQNKLPPSSDRWKQRSRTYNGIATAMAKQWGKLHNTELF